MGAAEEAAAATAAAIDSGTVMIHRRMNLWTRSKRIDLGLSVGLYCHWKSPTTIQTKAERCFNACCRTRLVSAGAASTVLPTCARCGQGHCRPCLRFHVTEATHDVEQTPRKQQFHAICPECVWQTIDVLAATQGAEQAALVNNLDSVVSQYFQGYVLSRAANLQNQIVRHEKEQEFVHVERRLQSELETLGQTKQNLEEQIHQAEENSERGAAPQLGDETFGQLRDDLEAIVEPNSNSKTAPAASVGLPWDLSYPSVRMHSQVLLMKNELDRQKLELERDLDRENARRQAELEAERDHLEDDIGQMSRAAEDTEAAPAQEEKLRRERARRRYEAEQARLRKERERAAKEARIRAEKQRLERERQKHEQETRQGLQGNDLRQCGRCGFGPFERFNCPDMAAHNDPIYVLDKRGRRVMRGHNECPECGWTNKTWNNWPKFRP